jgi:hypothetical protein
MLNIFSPQIAPPVSILLLLYLKKNNTKNISTTTTKKPTDLQHITKYFFIKTFHLYQVDPSCVICKVDHCGYNKICMSWEYFLDDRN